LAESVTVDDGNPAMTVLTTHALVTIQALANIEIITARSHAPRKAIGTWLGFQLTGPSIGNDDAISATVQGYQLSIGAKDIVAIFSELLMDSEHAGGGQE
jgi:hypothetical protein